MDGCSSSSSSPFGMRACPFRLSFSGLGLGSWLRNMERTKIIRRPITCLPQRDGKALYHPSRFTDAAARHGSRRHRRGFFFLFSCGRILNLVTKPVGSWRGLTEFNNKAAFDFVCLVQTFFALPNAISFLTNDHSV